MNRLRWPQGKSVNDIMTLLLFLVGFGWFIGCYVAGWRARVAGQDAGLFFSLMYITAALWSAPIRWWRYVTSLPRTLLHGLVWAYLALLVVIVAAVSLAIVTGIHEISETAMLWLAPIYVLIQVGLFWQLRTPAALRA